MKNLDLKSFASLDYYQSKKISFIFDASKLNLLIAGIYFIGVFFIEFLTFNTGYSSFFSKLNINADWIYTLAAFIHISFLIYFNFLFILLIISSKWVYRIPLLIIFGFASLLNYSYQSAIGRFFRYADIATAFGTTNEQKLDTVWSFLNLNGLFPLVILILICCLIKDKNIVCGGKKFFSFLFISTLFYIYIAFVNIAFFDQNLPNISFGSFFQTSGELAYHKLTDDNSPKVRETIAAVNNQKQPTNNIIFIFDESVRGDHFTINGYSRSTTPYLQELSNKGLLKNWGIAVSGATSSHSSYNAFICGRTAEMVDKKTNKEFSMPSIFQYAKAMNYKTYMYDGQMKEYWAGIKDDLNYIDNFYSVEDIKKIGGIENNEWEIDNTIAKLVNKVFTQSTGNFIFIYKRGSHFPYEKNYPTEAIQWQPIFDDLNQFNQSANKNERAINSYDNSIKYNVDSFFTNLAPDYSNLPNDTTVIYTSDHGETLFSNGMASHGGDTPIEANVPLIILGKFDKKVNTKFQASHSNLFTTVLDLFEYPEELRKYSYSKSLLKAKETDSQPRFYTSGLVEKMPFD